MKKNIEYTLLISVILISIFGIIMIYSSSSIWASYKFNDPFKYVKHQLLFFAIGIILMFFINKVSINFYYKNSSKIFFVCVILLVLVLIPGIGSVRNGSRSWFSIGPFGIQPSEFTKISIIILTSKYLTNSNKFIKNLRKGVIPILSVLFLTFGLIMLEPDFGTGMIIVVSVLALLFIAGVNIKFFLGLGLLGIIGITILIIIAPYRMDRITSFLNPWSDPLGTGFQIIQSLYAIGPGGLCYVLPTILILKIRDMILILRELYFNYFLIPLNGRSKRSEKGEKIWDFIEATIMMLNQRHFMQLLRN